MVNQNTAQPEGASPEPLVTAAPVAKLLAICERYVPALCAKHGIPVYRLGHRCVRYKMSEVLRGLGLETGGAAQ